MTTPLLSFCYPVHNRADLFARTLDSFVLQVDPSPYEIVVVDDGSTDDLLGLVRYYAEGLPTTYRLPLRYLRIDVDRCGVPVWHAPDGSNGPAVAWNVGIKAARGSWVVLSSPEVMHRRAQNVALLAHFVTAQRRPARGTIADVYDREWFATEFAGWIAGGPKQRALCFLAAFPCTTLLKIGGMEEAFMAGVAYDDNEFDERWRANGGEYVFTGDHVVAEHLPHPRPPHPEAVAVNCATYERLRGQRVANVGREWGHPACVVDVWS